MDSMRTPPKIHRFYEESMDFGWTKAEHECGSPAAHYRYTETHRSELLVIAGLQGSGCSFSVLRVLATSTHEIKVLFIYPTNLIYYYITHFDILLSVENFTQCTMKPTVSFY